eukprot:1139477-Pelagomonas_calceolata.AAC.2
MRAAKGQRSTFVPRYMDPCVAFLRRPAFSCLQPLQLQAWYDAHTNALMRRSYYVNEIYYLDEKQADEGKAEEPEPEQVKQLDPEELLKQAEEDAHIDQRQISLFFDECSALAGADISLTPTPAAKHSFDAPYLLPTRSLPVQIQLLDAKGLKRIVTALEKKVGLAVLLGAEIVGAAFTTSLAKPGNAALERKPLLAAYSFVDRNTCVDGPVRFGPPFSMGVREYKENLEQRMKYAEAPEKFLDSEVDLDEQVKSLLQAWWAGLCAREDTMGQPHSPDTLKEWAADMLLVFDSAASFARSAASSRSAAAQDPKNSTDE